MNLDSEKLTMKYFIDCFNQLTGHHPFDWQEKLFHKFCNGEFPEACDIPTGLGKTNVIAIWLIALGFQLKDKDRKIPLRLVYVVDRRVIVDQAMVEAENFLKKLKAALSDTTNQLSDTTNQLYELAKVFQESSFTGKDEVIALSTLRGQKADNREWCLDPSRPAIIIGTVDMIGSRLLFTGYGKVGINHRSLQAGLLGQDTMIVIDEAHLSPVFVGTLMEVKNSIKQSEMIRPFEVMLLSATLKSENPLRIDEEIECLNSFAEARLNAKKKIEWLAFDQQKKAKEDKPANYNEINQALAERLIERAVEYESGEPKSIMIFVQTVDLVNLIAEKLSEKLAEMAIQKLSSEEASDKKKTDKFSENIRESRILKMTGEMRSYERDGKNLIESPKFKAFLPREKGRLAPERTTYLIATSCAEVGVDLDADHGLCDLSTLDSMIQRIGRINRFGAHAEDSIITVLLDEKAIKAKESELSKEKERKSLIETLSDEIKALEAEKITKEQKKAHQAKLKKIKDEKKTLEKSGIKPDDEFKNIQPVKEKIFYTWKAFKAKVDSDDKINASPLALRDLLVANQDALPDEPVRPPLDAARIDDWAMTSLKQSEYPRPLVHYWLRGVIADESRQTTLVWRVDLDDFVTTETIPKEEAKTAIELATTIRIQPNERATLATFRAEELLFEIAKKNPKNLIVVIDPSGEATAYPLEKIAKDKKKFFERTNVSFSTIILPCQVGGLDKDGNPLDKLPKEVTKVDDVVGAEWSRFQIIRKSAEQFLIRPFAQRNDEIEGEKSYKTWWAALRTIKENGVCKNSKALEFAFATEEETNQGEDKKAKTYIAYFFNPKADKVEEAKKTSLEADAFLPDEDDEITSLSYPAELTVNRHNSDVGTKARDLAIKIGLPDEFTELLAAAGLRHDIGKAREWWQKAIGNRDYKPDEIETALAKSRPDVKSFDHGFNEGYRHEFGSLVETLDETELENHDLILHLIAAHHGYARPHFPERAFDRNLPKSESRNIAHEVMLRFNRLQKKYGWWQLAYLEAVLKAADALASRDFSKSQSGGNS